MNHPPQSPLQAGTLLTVGSHQVKIINYITSGGFAQIYSCTIVHPSSNTVAVACLKRVHVPDKQNLNTLRAEVDAMKALKGNKHVVSFIDSHAAKSPLGDGSYEVFLLMEYCSNGGLIDFMNTRLQDRLKEYEVLNIMNHVTQGIVAMHSLVPPLIHRDIKIENVLISENGDFKVCDFGSVCGVIRPPRNTYELNYVQHDILKNTTAQYRAPEMIDLYRGFPIDEKSDIWALGVFLYKLCYYTTPFEKSGEAFILQANFHFPAAPHYSDSLKNLINVMLRENPIQRPNVCQVLEEICRIQGVPTPVKNFYLERAIKQQQQPALPLAHAVSQSVLACNDQNMTLKAGAAMNKSGGILPVSVSVPYLPISLTNSEPMLYHGDDPYSSFTNSRAYADASERPGHITTMDQNLSYVRTPKMAFDIRASLPLNAPFKNQPIMAKAYEAEAGLQSNMPNNVQKDRRPVYIDSETQTTDDTTPAVEISYDNVVSNSSALFSSRPASQRNAGDSFGGLMHQFNRINSACDPYSLVDSAHSANSTNDRQGLHTKTSSIASKSASSNIKQNGIRDPKSSDDLSPKRSTEYARADSSTSFISELDDYEVTPDEDSNTKLDPLMRLRSNKDIQATIQERVHKLLSKPGNDSKSEAAVSTVAVSDQAIALKSDSMVIPQPSATEDHTKPLPIDRTKDYKKKPPTKPTKPAHLRPKPPPKPAHLKSIQTTKNNIVKSSPPVTVGIKHTIGT